MSLEPAFSLPHRQWDGPRFHKKLLWLPYTHGNVIRVVYTPWVLFVSFKCSCLFFSFFGSPQLSGNPSCTLFTYSNVVRESYTHFRVFGWLLSGAWVHELRNEPVFTCMSWAKASTWRASAGLHSRQVCKRTAVLLLPGGCRIAWWAWMIHPQQTPSQRVIWVMGVIYSDFSWEDKRLPRWKVLAFSCLLISQE